MLKILNIFDDILDTGTQVFRRRRISSENARANLEPYMKLDCQSFFFD